MKGGDWFTPSRGSRHLVTRTNARSDRYAALKEEAKRNAENRAKRETNKRQDYYSMQKEQTIRTLRELGLNERVIGIILKENNGFAIEYILKLNNDRGFYLNNRVQKDIREKYSNRINRLSDSDLRSFLNATDDQRNGYIRA